MPGALNLEKKRVLIIDDDLTLLHTLSIVLSYEGYHVDTAQTGKEAVEKSNANRYDLALIDFRLPDVEGTKLLTAIQETTPRMVKIILTGYPSESRRTEASERHADAFLVKPIKIPELLKTVRDRLQNREAFYREVGQKRKTVETIVAIGASAGGPTALQQVLSKIPDHQPAAFVISQHMPNGFTKALAQQLALVSNLRVREARQGDVLEEGDALITPGGFNMELASGGRVRLERTEQTPSPSINVMMKSTADVYGPRAVGVLLTGMLNDGALGMKSIKQQGGRTLVQDEASSVVYGMPKAALEIGAADRIVNISNMAEEIVKALSQLNGAKQEN